MATSQCSLIELSLSHRQLSLAAELANILIIVEGPNIFSWNVTPVHCCLVYMYRSPIEFLTEHSLDDSMHVTQPLAAVPPPPPHPATKRAQKKVGGATMISCMLYPAVPYNYTQLLCMSTEEGTV